MVRRDEDRKFETKRKKKEKKVKEKKKEKRKEKKKKVRDMTSLWRTGISSAVQQMEIQFILSVRLLEIIIGYGGKKYW